MSDEVPLTRQLRELHMRLDPSAPRYMANGQRKAAIQKLLGGGGGGEAVADGTATDGSAAGGTGPRTRPARTKAGNRGDSGPREAHGVTLPGTPGAPKPAGHKHTPQRADPSRNIDRFWRYLFG